MLAEDLPNPGSYDEFKAEIETRGYEFEDSWYAEMYTVALVGLGNAISERRGKPLLKIHDPDFVELRASSFTAAA
jgi:hypothetical protein